MIACASWRSTNGSRDDSEGEAGDPLLDLIGGQIGYGSRRYRSSYKVLGISVAKQRYIKRSLSLDPITRQSF